MAKTIKKKKNQTEVGRRKLFVKNIFICTFGTTNLVKKLHMGKDKMPITRNVLTEQINLRKRFRGIFPPFGKVTQMEEKPQSGLYH